MFLLFNAVDYIMWSLSWLSSGSVGKESACNAGDKGIKKVTKLIAMVLSEG